MIDLTLDAMKWPTGVDVGVGTQVAMPTRADAAGNIAMPFNCRAPITVAEDSTTSVVEHDAALVLQGNATLTLGAAKHAGLTVTVLGTMTSGQGFVVCKDESGASVAESVGKGVRCEFMSDASGAYHLYRRIANGDDIPPSADIVVRHNRFLRHSFNSSKRRTLVIKAGTHLRLDVAASDSTPKKHVWFDVAADKEVTLSSLSAGTDYCVYIVSDDSGNVSVTASTNTSYPSGYNTSNSRKIGWFHTECAAIPSGITMIAAAAHGATTSQNYVIKAAADSDSKAFYTKRITAVVSNTIYDTVTMAHPLAGWAAGDILPESVFCLTFRPQCEPAGMLFDADADAAGFGAIDIYLQSGTGANTKSRYNAAPTRSRQQQNHEDDMRSVGKRLLTDEEFTAVALGSNELTAIKGAAEASISGGTGGHVDTAGRRMVSAVGAEDCCGALYQWLTAVAATGGDGWHGYDGVNKLGLCYSGMTALVAGAPWSDDTRAGSRSRCGYYARAAVDAYVGARGASRMIKGVDGMR